MLYQGWFCYQAPYFPKSMNSIIKFNEFNLLLLNYCQFFYCFGPEFYTGYGVGYFFCGIPLLVIIVNLAYIIKGTVQTWKTKRKWKEEYKAMRVKEGKELAKSLSSSSDSSESSEMEDDNGRPQADTSKRLIETGRSRVDTGKPLTDNDRPQAGAVRPLADSGRHK